MKRLCCVNYVVWSIHCHFINYHLFIISSAACPEHTAVVVSYQSPAKPSTPGSGKQKVAAKVDIRLKPRGSQGASKERPHSLADFKTYKDTKMLVAKFLEHSSCSLPLEVQQVVNSIKFVIKSDERHMEEAIFSANIIDQVNVKTNRHKAQIELGSQEHPALTLVLTPVTCPISLDTT